MKSYLEKLKPYAAQPPAEKPPRVMPQDQSGPWGIENAARVALGAVLEAGEWNAELTPYAEYLITFITPERNHPAGPDAHILNGTALALMGYLAADGHPSADIWRVVGCARLATEAHRRRADIQDRVLTACVAAVTGAAAEAGAPILADLLTLDERMNGRLIDQSRAERLEVTADEYPSHVNVRLTPAEIGAYMRGREWQRAARNPEYLLNKDVDEALAACDNLIALRAHMHVRHQFGRDVEWHMRLFDDKESSVGLNSHRWIRDMAGAWVASKNARLPEAAARHIRSWYAACPMPNHKQPLGPWRTLEAGNRMCNQWLDAFGWFGETDAFDDELHALYALSRYDHMRYLTAYCGGPNNWYQVESSGIAVAALLSPELKDWETYLSIALRRLEWINAFAYYDDGFQFELTPGYHMYPTYSMFNVVRVARARGVALPEEFVRLMEKAHEMYLYAAQPDWSLPRLNDNGPGVVDGSAHLRDAAEMFGRDDLLWGGTHGGEGRKPDHASHAWPSAGYYCQRSGWEADARYLFFDAAPWGAAHQHEDKLTFVLHAYGRTLLGDPSIYSYATTELTHYFRSSRSHNVVLIDGMGQARRARPESMFSTDGRVEWVSCDAFDFVSGEYLEGWAPDTFADWAAGRPDDSVERGFAHRRAVWFVKPDYWVVFDLVTGDGVHTLEQLFHVPPFAEPSGTIVAGDVTASPDAIRSNDAGRANIAIVPVDRDGLTAEVFRGETSPARGWYSMGGELPSWEASFTARCSLPARMDAVLWPSPAGAITVPEVERLHVDAKTTAFRVRSGDIDDTFIVCEDDAGTVTVGEIEFNGRALLLRRGRGEGAFGVGVQSASLGGSALVVEPR